MTNPVEFEVMPTKGMQILGPFEGIENLMSGSARKIQVRIGEEEAKRDLIAEAVAGRI